MRDPVTRFFSSFRESIYHGACAKLLRESQVASTKGWAKEGREFNWRLREGPSPSHYRHVLEPKARQAVAVGRGLGASLRTRPTCELTRKNIDYHPTKLAMADTCVRCMPRMIYFSSLPYWATTPKENNRSAIVLPMVSQVRGGAQPRSCSSASSATLARCRGGSQWTITQFPR